MAEIYSRISELVYLKEPMNSKFLMEKSGRFRMLKIISIICSILIIGYVVVWIHNLGTPSVEAVEGYANIKLQKGSKVRSLERLSDGREVQFVVSFSLPEGGRQFCEVNHSKRTRLAFEPFSPREKGYDLLLGKPGICSSEKWGLDGRVAVVVREDEVVVYVDDR